MQGKGGELGVGPAVLVLGVLLSQVVFVHLVGPLELRHQVLVLGRR